MKFSTCSISFSVTSIRVPAGARAAISKAPESTSGKKSRRITGSSTTSVTASRVKLPAMVIVLCLQDHVEGLDVIRRSPIDQLFASERRLGR